MEYRLTPPSKFSLNAQELWRYRELFYFFTWRDIKVKYKQTALGVLWVVLQPLLLMAAFMLFFHKGLKMSTGDMPAPIFYMTGLLCWNIFSTGLLGASNSMVENAQMIKKVYFPRLVIPVSSILVAFFDFCIAFLIFVLLFVAYAFTGDFIFHFGRFLLFFPLALLLVLGYTLGLGCALAALNVQYRDVRYVIPFLIQLLFFLSPVIYPIEVLNAYPLARILLAINPLSGALDLFRSCFSNHSPDWFLVATGTASMCFILLTGIYVFRKMEAYFADIA